MASEKRNKKKKDTKKFNELVGKKSSEIRDAYRAEAKSLNKYVNRFSEHVSDEETYKGEKGSKFSYTWTGGSKKLDVHGEPNYLIVLDDIFQKYAEHLQTLLLIPIKFKRTDLFMYAYGRLSKEITVTFTTSGGFFGLLNKKVLLRATLQVYEDDKRVVLIGDSKDSKITVEEQLKLAALFGQMLDRWKSYKIEYYEVKS